MLKCQATRYFMHPLFIARFNYNYSCQARRQIEFRDARGEDVRAQRQGILVGIRRYRHCFSVRAQIGRQSICERREKPIHRYHSL